MAGLSGSDAKSSNSSSSFFNVIKSDSVGSNGSVTSLVDAKPAKTDSSDVMPTPTPKDNKLPNQPVKVGCSI